MRSMHWIPLLAIVKATFAWLHAPFLTSSPEERFRGSSNAHRVEQGEHGNDRVGASTTTISRRQWFAQSIGSAAIATVGTSMSPQKSNAEATVVSTQAVCDPGVSVWRKDSRLVYLLGTAHISSASAVLAGDLVKDIHPKGVFVELDPKRVKGSGILANRIPNGDVQQQSGNADVEDALIPKSRIIVPNIDLMPRKIADSTNGIPALVSTTNGSDGSSTTSAAPTTTTNPSRIMPNPIMNAASQVVGNSIKGMYKKLDSAGFQAGEEFVVAVREGQKIGSDIVLGDRDVEVTLRRVTEGLARTDLKALMNPDSELEQSLKELVPSTVPRSSKGGDDDYLDLSDAEFRTEFSNFVETMKAKENVRKVMSQLSKLAPALYEALVSERDAYMAAGLNGLDELETIVAVVGVAHVDGIETNLSMNGWKAVSPSCTAPRLSLGNKV